jgi:uncharacterized membrane protein
MERSAADKAWPRPAVGPVRLADALGWGSAALGTPMLVSSRRFLNTIGVEDDPKAVRWTLFVGAREFLATLTIVANRHRRIGAWSRVAGDTMDAALLMAAFAHKRRDARRLRGAMGAVGAIMAADLYTAVQLTRAEGGHIRDGSGSTEHEHESDIEVPPGHVVTAATIRRPEDEVRRAFEAFDWSVFDPAEVISAGAVRFTRAPGDRGTEVHIDFKPDSNPLLAKVVGQAPDQKIHDDLRRFKAIVETGVVARSEKSLEGPSATRQIFHKQRPAQPVGKDA